MFLYIFKNDYIVYSMIRFNQRFLKIENNCIFIYYYFNDGNSLKVYNVLLSRIIDMIEVMYPQLVFNYDKKYTFIQQIIDLIGYDDFEFIIRCIIINND